MSPWSFHFDGGDEGIRTPDPLLAGQVLSQLSYTPIFRGHSKSNNKSTALFTLPFRRDFLSLRVRFNVFRLEPCLLRKEVIQPHLPIRLPCYDLTPIIEPTFGSCPLAVSSLTSGLPDFRGLTGGVYKARERIHRGMLIRDY